ncbi:MAG TPA: VWA domain-containing protein [Gammaproteobacteria bacterium]|nr:VWA domain-containing protein [Xanthomonadales bacterium]MCB1593514.1 VWA domain-containing protein [Xanthomonadales bacterium]HOP21726.1 VWA domain-containing protein [Gammaproteobacteria bacterium]HPI95266.1 VWA domain-containing protein [Gammaproteobacteria bacterium]HPQ86655.1 VWA domain-containing protein [Gammaproteobacteria bacterium]
MKKIIFLLCFMFIATILQAQDKQSPILFIYDASGSMWGQIDGKSKKEIASEVLSNIVDSLPENQNIGLVAYGHRNKGNCDDIEYIADIANEDKTRVINAIKSINPLGKTPLARSATLVIDSLKVNSTKATIILVTDGIESCDGNICDVVTKAQSDGIDFKMHIVGFGLKEDEKQQLICAAEASNGNYYDAENAAGLNDVLIDATKLTVDEPDGNFSIYAEKNGEPVDAWIKPKDAVTKKDLEGSRTYRRKGWVYLPPGKYDIEVKPLEGSDIPAKYISVEIKEGEVKHQDINFDGGILQVATTNNSQPWDSTVKMYDQLTGNLIAQSRTYGKAQQMEVLAGTYKIVYQALALDGTETVFTKNDVEVEGNSITESNHDFSSGVAMIGVQSESGELIDATVNFYEELSGKNVSGSRTYTSSRSNPKKFVLNPGTYKVKIQTLGKHKGYNESFSLTIKEGDTIEKLIITSN